MAQSVLYLIMLELHMIIEKITLTETKVMMLIRMRDSHLFAIQKDKNVVGEQSYNFSDYFIAI